jgi:hypothetical protein
LNVFADIFPREWGKRVFMKHVLNFLEDRKLINEVNYVDFTVGHKADETVGKTTIRRVGAVQPRYYSSVMIEKLEFYHGAALVRLIEDPRCL